MSKRSKIRNPISQVDQLGRIHLPQEIENINYNDLQPAFSFEYVQDKYCLSNWDKKSIKRLIDKLGKLEKYKWKDILIQQIFHFKAVDRKGLKVLVPDFITPDVTIYYIKPFGTNTPYRVFGIREGHNFKFLWFDATHEIYPGK